MNTPTELSTLAEWFDDMIEVALCLFWWSALAAVGGLAGGMLAGYVGWLG